ncbi:cytochrome c oxidase subunit 3 [Bradyrhizobium japonicum]|jgi:cytochrome c oxidase subunit III|uniref:cytochrome c oxidase subunit 3 n=1 Tax=Bradyrhizobium japonicum TaxID=375 RepID=UPI002714CE42|nr:cytochrome c oxidase subunit 3 [Bradyrhizobium japonicum]WLB24396.1 cytochrome c oxidase subunit 3 [Bradyrhizobium japonicum]
MSDETALLREPWLDFARQREAGKFGIWVFLASETLFFGALMLTYMVCRIEHPEAFVAAGRETNIWYGTINTAVLLTSSLTMAVAAQGAESYARLRRLVIACLMLTALLGLAFIVIKGFEYKEDMDKHLVPGAGFALPERAAQLFYGFYWLVTSVHAIHLSIGIALVGRLVWVLLRRELPVTENPEIEVTALYWHLVDIVWIFLYPLIYLPGRSS